MDKKEKIGNGILFFFAFILFPLLLNYAAMLNYEMTSYPWDGCLFLMISMPVIVFSFCILNDFAEKRKNRKKRR